MRWLWLLLAGCVTSEPAELVEAAPPPWDSALPADTLWGLTIRAPSQPLIRVWPGTKSAILAESGVCWLTRDPWTSGNLIIDVLGLDSHTVANLVTAPLPVPGEPTSLVREGDRLGVLLSMVGGGRFGAIDATSGALLSLVDVEAVTLVRAGDMMFDGSRTMDLRRYRTLQHLVQDDFRAFGVMGRRVWGNGGGFLPGATMEITPGSVIEYTVDLFDPRTLRRRGRVIPEVSFYLWALQHHEGSLWGLTMGSPPYSPSGQVLGAYDDSTGVNLQNLVLPMDDVTSFVCTGGPR